MKVCDAIELIDPDEKPGYYLNSSVEESIKIFFPDILTSLVMIIGYLVGTFALMVSDNFR